MIQKAMVELFNVEQPVIVKHLINIYNEKDLDKDSTYSKMELVQKEVNRQVTRHIQMTMEDWTNRLDDFLKLTDREILQDAGKILHKIACDKTKSEFEKYRIIHTQIYISDFDKYINKLDVSDKSE